MFKYAIKNWAPVAFWLTLIAIESTGSLSAANTGSILWRILSACFGHLDPKSFEFVHFFLRKFGHFTGYGILCLLIFRGLYASFQRTAPLLWSVLAILATFAVACLDEWHQTSLPGRTGLFRDVLLDTAGAIFVQIILLIAQSRRASISALDTSV